MEQRLLVIGGTSESGPLIAGLCAQGWSVLLSTVTDESLNLPATGTYRRRIGALNSHGFVQLLRAEACRAVVCAAHPYATQVRAEIVRAAAEVGVPCLIYDRPPGEVDDSEGIVWVSSHGEAAARVFQEGRCVFLACGVRHLLPYAQAAAVAGGRLWVRILDRPDSRAAALAAGIPPECILVGRGPFSVEENIRQFSSAGADVLVTKESGDVGGLREKLVAARRCDMRVVIIARPRRGAIEHTVSHVQTREEVLAWAAALRQPVGLCGGRMNENIV